MLLMSMHLTTRKKWTVLSGTTVLAACSNDSKFLRTIRKAQRSQAFSGLISSLSAMRITLLIYKSAWMASTRVWETQMWPIRRPRQEMNTLCFGRRPLLAWVRDTVQWTRILPKNLSNVEAAKFSVATRRKWSRLPGPYNRSHQETKKVASIKDRWPSWKREAKPPWLAPFCLNQKSIASERL